MRIALSLLVIITAVTDVESLIREAPLPIELKECYQKYSRKSLATVVGKSLCWYCETSLRGQMKAHTTPLVLPQSKYFRDLAEPLMNRRYKRQATGSRCIRKEYRMMTRTERENYHRAIQALKADTTVEPNMYDALAMFHVGDASVRAHGGPGFLGWHRMYLVMYERALQSKVPGVCVPYIDNTIEAELGDDGSYLWSDEFVGTPNGVVTSGPFANWNTPIGELTRNVGNQAFPMDKDILRDIMARERIEEIVSPTAELEHDLEYHHGSYHIHVGGLMESIDTASFEPVFFMHHAYIDYVWELFRQKTLAAGGDPTRYPEPTNLPLHNGDSVINVIQTPTRNITVTQSDMYATLTDYEYMPSPECSRANPDCGSVYLACNRTSYRCYPVDPSLQPPVTPVQPVNPGPPVRPVEPVNPGPTPTDPWTPVDPGTPRDPWTPVNPGPPTDPWTPVNPGPPTDPWTPVNPGPPTDPWVRPVQPVNPGTPINPAPPVNPRPTRCFDSNRFIKAPRKCQNTFCIDGVCDTNKWLYFPVKVISNRAPEFSGSGSYPVRNGKVMTQNDIYEPKAYTAINRYVKTRAVEPKGYGNCQDTHGIGQIFISSQGINYEGFYSESSIIDQRLATSISIAYLAVKDVGQSGKSTALLRAFDQCGRICHTACRIPGSNPAKYRPCSGVVDVTDDFPKQYSSTYGESILQVWGYKQDRECPVFEGEDFFMAFYCDYKDRLPWVEPGPGTARSQSTPIRPIDTPQPVLPPKPKAVCKVNHQCTVEVACENRRCTTYGTRYKCMEDCRRYAICVYGRLYARSCVQGLKFDGRTCVPGTCSTPQNGSRFFL